MPHPLVTQLRFTRDELVRGLQGVTDDEARRRFQAMNSISWMIGHMAWQEQRYWLFRAQGQVPLPDLNERVANGKPATTPPLEEMWTAWRAVTRAGDPWLDALTTEGMQAPLAEGFGSSPDARPWRPPRFRGRHRLARAVPPRVMADGEQEIGRLIGRFGSRP